MSGTDSLTAEDLRARLYSSLRDKGLVDALKSQLRNKLVSELRQVGVEQHFTPEPQHSTDGSLLHKASNSLVADHLRRSNYDYSLSVFLPECGCSESQLFTTRDLLQLLNISPQSRLHKNLTSQSGAVGRKGFLWQLLCEIAAMCGHSCRDTGVQTDATRIPPPTSLEEQFRKLDSYYDSVGDDHKQKWMAVEERILSYQRHLDDRTKTEMQLEMARFKENELQRMRMEEREKNRQDMERIRKEMELSYQSKSQSLLGRERHGNERLQKEKEIADKETYSQRQSLLQEIEAVRQREETMRRQEEVNFREKCLWEEKMKTKDQLVKKREEDVRKAEIEYNQKLHDEIQKFKLEEQARLLDKTKDLDYREIRVRENERRLDDELRNINQVKEDLRHKRKQCIELEGDLTKFKHENMTVKAEVEILQTKAREMVDYQIVKEENAITKREMDNLKIRLSELTRDLMMERQKNEELLREMTERASKPTPEVYLMQKEVDRVRNEMKQERAIFMHQKQSMDKRYQDEIDRTHELLRKYEEQTLQLEEMNREIRDLRQQLGQHKIALTNEVYRKPKPSLLTREDSLCELEADAVDPTLIKAAAEPEYLFSASTGLIDNILTERRERTHLGTHSQSDDYSYSMDLVDETKKRLRNLEREAENLEHHYQNFHYRMTTVPVVPGLEEPPLVPATTTPSRNKVGFKDSIHNIERTPQNRVKRSTVSSSPPMSSTPARQHPRTVPLSGTASAATIDLVGDSSLVDNSMSTVQSSSPIKDEDDKNMRSRPLSVGDLEQRPGSPDIVVVPASDSRETLRNNKQLPPLQPFTLTAHQKPPKISSGAAQEPPVISLDSAWKQQDSEADRRRQEEQEARRRQQEEEDRVFEEEQRRREEERRRKEQEAWEREQRELEALQGSQVPSESAGPARAEAPSGDEKKDQEGIDPTMLKYMEMVKQQKDREKEVVKKTINTWNKGRKDKTPSVSEDMSQTEEKSVEDVSDGDFW